MAESAEDQTAGAVNASQPGSTKPSRPEVKNKGTKWGGAPDVVGEEKPNETGSEPKPGADPEPQPAAQGAQGGNVPDGSNVAETAGTVNIPGKQDEGEFKPARAENDPMQNDPAPKPQPEPQAQPEETAGPGKFDPMPDQERGDYDKSSGPDGDQSGAYGSENYPSFEQQEIKRLQGEVDAFKAREAEVSRREQAVQPATATITDRDVDAQIIGESYVDGATAFGGQANMDEATLDALSRVTICALRLRHGGVMIGTAESDGRTESSLSTLTGAAKADARAQVEAGLRFAHRMKFAGI